MLQIFFVNYLYTERTDQERTRSKNYVRYTSEKQFCWTINRVLDLFHILAKSFDEQSRFVFSDMYLAQFLDLSAKVLFPRNNTCIIFYSNTQNFELKSNSLR